MRRVLLCGSFLKKIITPVLSWENIKLNLSHILQSSLTSTLQKCQYHKKQGKTEKLSLETKETATDCNVVS